MKISANELEERLLDFAVNIINLSRALPGCEVGRHISKQMMRSGTSPSPNYAEARGAESRADFAHKLGIVLKELNETKIWLRMIVRAELLNKEKVETVMTEATELSKIIQASVNTLRKTK